MARMQHPHAAGGGVHGIEQMVVVHPRQGEQPVHAVPEQGVNGGLGGGHAGHGGFRNPGAGAVVLPG